jgi:acetyl-CoA carboxylase carboxyltransferase component
MGGEQAAKTLLQIQVNAMQAKGKEVSPEEEQSLLKAITDRYNSQISPYYAAARLWVDAVIDPVDTRRIISESLTAANQSPIEGAMKVGVFQV